MHTLAYPSCHTNSAHYDHCDSHWHSHRLQVFTVGLPWLCEPFLPDHSLLATVCGCSCAGAQFCASTHPLKPRSSVLGIPACTGRRGALDRSRPAGVSDGGDAQSTASSHQNADSYELCLSAGHQTRRSPGTGVVFGLRHANRLGAHHEQLLQLGHRDVPLRISCWHLSGGVLA
jgi:hypothetical protein